MPSPLSDNTSILSCTNSSSQKNTLPKMGRIMAVLSACLLSLTACQTIKTAANSPTTGLSTSVNTPARLQSFNIRGKIGVVTAASPSQETVSQSGSAFYVWAQEGDRFAIDMTGALGIGHTVIEYNGATATLVSERTGTLTANNPDELLAKATGWHAPISQLPYWISGRPTPSDSDNKLDTYGRLQTAHNADWTATFSYKNEQETLPSKISAQREDGYKVTMTMTHTE